ncbi:tRNA (adenosine(37)-N6)-threonylcarbamoyltransferase complex dimerization subunit type 1 TsaB [Microbacterium indicum]|uniref:tRNA (adenosine(37)-N6)-threonylcarbamoyltransferase complex dimerization subunit type 1 TsaB n=1 Tax=Microbacterium indicum TaxID=358100 RepID=UPI0004143B89|nr:tRNA (adenosine(37)-N6)-threonylcarbamoyltransferase complex dimerization subunit type 1 TsaB [Microbacterium indicum]
MILAIDTSLGTTVAVVDRATGAILSQADSEGTRGHAEVIGTLIEGALEGAGATPLDIEAVAAGMGPGPFTGLRIGIAAARAFAVGRGIPVVPVVSHDAPALEAIERGEGAPTITTDARRREHAVSAYAGVDADGIPVRTTEPHLEQACDGGGLTERISAGSLGRVAARMLAAGRIPELDEPLYLRAPDAKLPGAPKRVSA